MRISDWSSDVCSSDLSASPLPAAPVHRLPSRPDISKLSPEAQRATRMAEDGEGGVALTVAEDAPEEVQREVAAAIEPFVPGSIESFDRYTEQAAAARSPAERGWTLAVTGRQRSGTDGREHGA